MNEYPGFHDRSLFGRERARDDFTVIVDLCLAVAIPGMEVRRVVLTGFLPVHGYYDAIEH